MYLAIGQENTEHHLALFAVDSTGHLYDPASVSFRIVDLSTSTQVFPVSGLEDVTTEGKVDKGVYRAFDTTLDVGWTPEVGATVGKHRIEWTYRDADDTKNLTHKVDFYVYTAGFGAPYWTYLAPNEVRDEGVDTSELSDARLLDLILRAQELVERECQQPFRPVRHTFRLDGNGSTLMPLSVPIVGIEHLKIGHSTQVMAATSYAVYFVPVIGQVGGWVPKDWRRNPKIKLRAEFASSPFRNGGAGFGSLGAGRFQPGAQPHEVKGVFGFLEPGGTTPRPIRDAMLRLVLATATQLEIGPGGGAGPGGPVKRERTDRHEVEFAVPGDGAVAHSELLTSRAVEEILLRYKRPIAIGAPATTWATVRNP